MHVERLGRAEPVLVPDVGHQVLARDHPAGVAHQPHEQVELLAREVERRAVEHDAACAGIEPQPADLHRRLERRGRVAAAAAQHRADARDHLGGAERLDHVVVGAQLEADDPVRLGAARGEHDDRDRRLAPQLAADLAPVAVRAARCRAGRGSGRGGGRAPAPRAPSARSPPRSPRARARSRTARRSSARPRRAGSSAVRRLASRKGSRRDPRIRRFGRTFTRGCPVLGRPAPIVARDLISTARRGGNRGPDPHDNRNRRHARSAGRPDRVRGRRRRRGSAGARRRRPAPPRRSAPRS